VHILRGNDRHALLDRPIPHIALHRAAYADLHAALRIDQPFAYGVPERRPMAEFLAKTFRPGIDMRVEMHKRQRSRFLVKRTQQRQCNAVFAAQRDQMVQPGRLLLDQRQAFGNITERNGKIADIGKRPFGRLDPGNGVRAIHEHAARMANGMRPEPRPGAVRGADIERNAGDCDRRCLVVPRYAQEAGRRSKRRRIGHKHCPEVNLSTDYHRLPQIKRKPTSRIRGHRVTTDSPKQGLLF